MKRFINSLITKELITQLHLSYVADKAKSPDSQNIKPTLEDAYIYALGGVKR